MLISAIVPVRNEENSISDLLNGLLEQSRPPDEIVITDGGSSDKTVSIIEEFRERGAPIHLVRTGAALPGRGRNLAAREASSEWLAFIDAGIKPDVNWLKSLSTRACHADADVVYGSYEPVSDTTFKECAAIAYVRPAIEVEGQLMRSDSIASCLMKRSVWEEAGGFPEHLRSAEDLLFMNRVRTLGGRISYEPSAVVHWNLQPDLWKTFKRFVVYARSNLQAGLWKQWQAAIFTRYALLALTALPAFFFGWRWLLVTLLLWILMLVARSVVAIIRNARCYPAGIARNLRRLLTLVPLLATLDLAAFVGSTQWLFKDKLRLHGNEPALTTRS